MKKRHLLVFALFLFGTFISKQSTSQTKNNSRKITPHELAGTIASALEQLRVDLKTNKLSFTSAELELSTTSTISGGGGLSVKIVNVSVDRSKETEVKVAYSLSDMLAEEQESTASIESLEALVSNIKSTNKGATPKMTDDQKLKMNEMLWATARSSEAGDAAEYISAAENSILKFQNKRKSDYEKCEAVIVSSVNNAIQEYNELKKTYGKVCFSVSISFAVSTSGEGGISLFDVISADGSYSKENTHSLVLFFGDCD